MVFSKELNSNFSRIKTIYDMVAYCYYYLKDTVENENVFLGDYIKVNKNAELLNPNLEMLNSFSMSIKKILRRDPFTLFSSALSSNELLELVETAENNLKGFGNVLMNHATIPFFILQGLDLYFEDCTYKTFKTWPLNECCKEFCLIYLNCKSSLMDRIIMEKKYPKTIRANEIRYYFKHIIILEKHELPKGYGNPKLTELPKEQNDMERIVASSKLKIAVVPAIRDKWFGFPVKQGASFEVRYDEQRIESVKKRVVGLLDWAIACGVNIIVFPEYICKEEIQNEIRETLSRICLSEPEKLKELLFVVAGSGWSDDSNNVSCLYSYDGNPLGKVYKYSAYDNDIDGEEYVERLQNPGKEITLVKIPEIGIFQTEICRNVSENEFCLRLSKVFDTQFLLIAAWSPSVNIGFKKQIDAIISSNHKTCSAMCNCCAAFSGNEEFREEIGVMAAPQKRGSLVEGSYKYLKRTKQQCDSSCGKGCIFEICFDFNGTAEDDVKITYDFRKKP